MSVLHLVDKARRAANLFAAVILAIAPVTSRVLPALAQQDPPAMVTVVANPAQRIVLYLEPGFNTFLVFDAGIEFVAVGDEQVLTTSVRGQEGIIGLRPNGSTGRTNMHVQAGGVLVVFEVQVTRGHRTADVVRVITRPAAAMQPAQPSPGAAQPAPPSPKEPVTPPREQRPVGAPTRSLAPSADEELLPNPIAFLTEEGSFRLQEISERGVRGVFQAYRTASGIEVRYQITNTSGVPWQVISSRILVRADGKIVFPKILRHTSSPDGRTLPHGMVETGVIVLLAGARDVEITFPLFPEVLDPRRLPIVFAVQFRNLQALPEVRLR